MDIHEIKSEIEKLETRAQTLKKMIETIRANGNTLPLGRARDKHGPEKYDEPDGIGFYKAQGENTDEYSIGQGEYMQMGDEPYVFSEEVISKFEDTYKETVKGLEKMRAKLEKAEKKIEREPATKEHQIDDEPLEVESAEQVTREQLEEQLREIEKNHYFIRDNTALVNQSKSLWGRIRRFLGEKKLLGFGDIQKRVEEIRKAIDKEQAFISKNGVKTYEEALNNFKYGRKEGPKKIQVVESVGYHDEHTKVVEEITLSQFDHICDEVGRRLFEGNGVIEKDEYVALASTYSVPEEDSFSKSLQKETNDTIEVERDEKLEELLGLEAGSRLHDTWRAPRKKEDGKYEPRMRPTGDKKWIEAHGTDQVDIANTSFENLPEDWQHENLEAGKEAVSITGERTEMTPEELREASVKVHEAWCERKRKAIEDSRQEMLDSGMAQDEVEAAINDKYGWDMGLMVDFDELSPEEQQKDTDHILTVMKINKELESGELTKAQLARKFENPIQQRDDI